MSTFDDIITTLDRSSDLNAEQRAEVAEALPIGMELVQGDFAEDEKWRIVQTVEQPVVAGAVDVAPEIDYPVIGECFDCSKPIREGESRVEDHRGLWHPDHYQASA